MKTLKEILVESKDDKTGQGFKAGTVHPAVKSALVMHHEVGDYHELQTIHDVLKKIHPDVQMDEVGFNGKYHGISHFGTYTRQFKTVANRLAKKIGVANTNEYGVKPSYVSSKKK